MKNLLLFSQFLLLVLIPLHLAYGQSIGGHVYIDYNSSGTYESTDKGIFSVKLYLYNKCDNGLVVDSTNTDIDGNYSFQGLNGDYTVKIDVNDPVYKNGNSFSQNCCFVINTQGQNEICNLGFAMPNCTSNPYSVDNLCDLAFDNPLLDLRKIGDFPCGQITSVLGPWPGQPHCGGIYDNTSFFGFVAGSGDYSINITVFSCAGKGIQYGIIDACSPGGSLVVCSGEANTGLITIATNTLEPCKRYVLWLDGYEGSVCSYYVNVTGNFKICDPIIEENKPLAIGIDLNLVCDSTCNQNFGKVLKLVSNDSLPKIDKFDWLISNASTTIVQITTTPEIDISSLSPGQYDVCVRIDSSATYAETKYCKKITIESDYGVVKNTFTLCETELPWFGASDSLGNKLLDVFGTHWRWTKGPIIWSDLQIGKNTFINDHTDKCGCSYQQEIAVIYHVRGQACDDNDETTINDLVLDDCTCKGTRTSGITTNTTWYFRPFFVTPNNDVWQVKALRDTLIDQQIYKIVGLNRGNGFIKQTEIPLAQVDGRMYFYEDDERKLLYDFNAKVDEK
ncbi:MAG: hypothetical protein IPN86_13295 [Saprospiraceae bacterium]|nr:hypothetical protein [Saprospiraceae bacterium]